ncbi:hypothetical protein [Paenibacillus sp. OK003]|uniref:hypothetical protein n=1 Tax=Paenibacillus sp. OK003 TaxID=1884380 RepID=UPI0008AE2D85|nr:hypothetical protein [Paenibacillus sp. OK003]SEK77813.1 hypothetical protein SAMN05518856_104312 [Paenibacillus sp. OK003]
MYLIATIALLALILFATGCQKDEASPVHSPETVQVPDTQKMYYISPQGNDLNKGTLQSPWETLQHAADHATPGSTVYLREGVYHQKVKITRSGNSSGNPTLFSSYPQEKAIIDGEGLSVRGIEGLIEVELVLSPKDTAILHRDNEYRRRTSHSSQLVLAHTK